MAGDPWEYPSLSGLEGTGRLQGFGTGVSGTGVEANMPGLTDFPSREQAAQNLQAQQYSGKVDPVGPWEAFTRGIGVYGGPPVAAQQIMQERGRPIAQKLAMAGKQALLAGDWDTVSQVSQGWTELASSIPSYASMADSFIQQANKTRQQIEGNNALLDYGSQRFGNNKEAQQGIGFLRSKVAVIPFEGMQKLMEQAMPDIKVEPGYTSITDKYKGTTEIRTTPQMRKATDMPADARQGLLNAGIDENRVAQLANKHRNFEQLSDDDLNYLKTANKVMSEFGREQTSFARVPAALELEKDLPPGAVRQLDRRGSTGSQVPTNGMAQQQMLQEIPKNAKAFNFNPQELLAYTGIISHESSLGMTNIGDGGDAHGPGMVHKAALKDFNDTHSTDIKLKELSDNPALGAYVSAGYFRILLDRNKGDIPKAVQAYNNSRPENGKGDPNYVQNVMSKGQAVIQSIIQQRQQQGIVPGNQGIPQSQGGMTPGSQPMPTQPGSQAQTTQTPVPPYPAFQEPPPGTSIGQRSALYEAWKAGQKQYQEQVAMRTGQGRSEPTGENMHYYKYADGQIEEYTGERLPQGAMGGYLKTSEPAQAQLLRSEQGFLQQGTDLFNEIKDFPKEDWSSFGMSVVAKLIGNGIYIPITLPFTGGKGIIPFEVPGLGVGVTLPYKEAALYNKITSFVENTKKYTETSGQGSKYIESVKAALTGAFANKDSMLHAVKSTLEVVDADVRGRFSTVPGSSQGKLNLELPTTESKGGIPRLLEDSDKAQIDLVKKGIKGVATLVGEAVQTTGKTASELWQGFDEYLRTTRFAGKGRSEMLKYQPTPKELLSDFQGFLKTLTDPNYKPANPTKTESMYNQVTPNWARKPINPETKKALSGMK